MKRNILLGFLLVGLVVMEWGCKKASEDYCPPCPGASFKITEIDSIKVTDLENDKVLQELDSVQWDNLVVPVYLETERLAMQQVGNYGLWACQPCGGSVLKQLDSIKIFDGIHDVSSKFGFAFDGQRQYTEKLDNLFWLDDLDFWDSEFKLQFLLTETLEQKDTLTIGVQLYTASGDVFFLVADPIIITP